MSQGPLYRSFRPPPMLWVGALLGAGFWLVEALVHFRLFDPSGRFIDHLLPTDPDELWMRGMVVGLLLSFGGYADRLRTRYREADRDIRDILENTTDAYLSVDRDWRVRYMNARAELLLGCERSGVLGESLWDAFPEAASTFYKPLHEAMGRNQERTFQAFYSGADTWMEVHTYPRDGGMAFYLRDIADQRGREQSLRDANKRLTTILDSAGDGIISINRDGIIETFNKAAERIFGYGAGEAIGRNVSMLAAEPHASRHDSYLSNYLRTGVSKIIDGGPREVEALRKDGSSFPMDLAVSEMRLGDERFFIGIVRDITERKRAQEALEYMSNFDPLTDLPNRSLLRDRLAHALQQAHRDEHLVAVMFLDLDRFKMINDTLGHAVGDELLKTVAQRITACLREGDTVARLGGDEFVIVLEHIHHVDNAALVAAKVLASLARPMSLKGHEVIISASIGITIYPFDDEGVDDLLRDADAAMYRAKEAGRNNYQYFTADMTAQALMHMSLEQDLRRALDRNEFELYYQPQVELEAGAVTGVEALLRWHHPERGLVSPADFVPVLEETGLILAVGHWVIEEACRQSRAWVEQGLAPMRVAVNVSARQFYQATLIQDIETILAEVGLSPEYLELEITESLLVENVSATINTLNRLNAMGIRLSIDDFGTGYSSLAYLKRFPLHTLKIDQSFVADVTDDLDSAAIAQAIIAMARSLRLGVIAEGVETEEQLRFLDRNGCSEVQGYLFCRPLPASQLTDWLRENRDRRLA